MTIFEQLLPAAPIDRVARRVTGKGQHWEPRFTRNAGGAQLPKDAPPAAEQMPQNMADIAGLRRGRMVAVQYQGRSAKKRHLWLMRCDCGMYETRQSEKWAASEGVDCCQRCDEAHHVKTGRYLAQLRPSKGPSKAEPANAALTGSQQR